MMNRKLTEDWKAVGHPVILEAPLQGTLTAELPRPNSLQTIL